MSPLPFTFCGEALLAHPSGALIWEARKTVVFSDLHLGKSQALARRAQQFLPPYETAETLGMMAEVLEAFDIQTVLLLGDSFDRQDARLLPDDLETLEILMTGRDWIWILGNHDPDLPHALPGERVTHYERSNLLFRHEAHEQANPGEVSGHFHPKASVRISGRRIRKPCFIHDPHRLILPAFGTYTGGLDVTDPAVARFFPNGTTIYLCHGPKIYPVPASVRETAC